MSRLNLKVLFGGPALLLGGLYFTATTTFDKAEDIIWQMRAIGPVTLLLSPVLLLAGVPVAQTRRRRKRHRR